MTTLFRSSRSLAAPVLVGLVVSLAACREPVGPAAAAPAVESAVQAAGSPRFAAGAGFDVDAMTIETRYWNSAPWVVISPEGYASWTQPFPTGLAAVAEFDALPRGTPGYTNVPIELSTMQCAIIVPGQTGTPPDYVDGYATHYDGCIRNPGDGVTASFSNLAIRYRLRVTATKTTTFAVRFGVDFMGGVLIVDGNVISENWNDPFWNGYFEIDNGDYDVNGNYQPLWETDVNTVLTASFQMRAGTTHIIEVVGFENALDYGASAQFNDGSGWLDAISMVPAYKVPLSVSTGAGGGQVVSAPAGINCGAICTFNFAWATMPTLTPIANQYFAFTGWSGDCIGTGWCAPLVETPKSVTATFTRVQWPLQVSLAGNGQGSVSSSPSGISCGAACLAGFAVNSTVTLTAAPAVSSDFAGWSGACSGTAPTCTVPMTQAQNVTATFSLKRLQLTVAKPGNGSGTVTSTPGAINCGTACNSTYDYGTTVTLTATPTTGSTFAGWTGGGCSGTGVCVVTVTLAQTISANFTLNTYALNVTKSGAGTITSADGAINCGTTCAATFNYGTTVTLTATPDASTDFTGWSGACSGTGTCTVTVTQAQNVSATFTTKRFVLTVAKAGTGAGAVSSSPAGINCGATCSATYDYGTTVTLTATPATGSTFAGWTGGGCSGIGPCVVTVTQAQSVTATYTLNTYALTVVKSGTGAGTVASSPSGINCGADCTEIYNYGTTVTLTATPSTGSTFAGWSGGGCSGTGPCVVSVTQAQAVTATYTLNSYTLTVTKSGVGTITSSNGAINCGATCSATLDYGTTVTLTATPDASYDFIGWGGACSGTGACTVTMAQATTVSASFRLRTFQLEVVKSGTGSGLVTSSPAGISCGAQCAYSFVDGTNVTLTAAPAGNSDFAGWSGACSGTGPCVVSVTAAKSVTAAFTFKPGTDTDPPVISCRATPTVLWPVNHKLVDVSVSVSLTDAGSGPAGYRLVSVESNEAPNVTADGNTSVDWAGWTLGTADIRGQFRAERAGNLRDRIYSLTYVGSDAAGNLATTSCAVTVPHDQRK